MAKENGGTLMMWILKITLPILIAGTLGTVKWVSTMDGTVTHLTEVVQRIKKEGTDICRKSELAEVRVSGKMDALGDKVLGISTDLKILENKVDKHNLAQIERQKEILQAIRDKP